MRLIKLTTIEKADIAIVVDEIISIEKGDYDWEMEKQYGFAGRPTRILTKHCNYSVREDFDTVYTLIEGADDEDKSRLHEINVSDGD